MAKNSSSYEEPLPLQVQLARLEAHIENGLSIEDLRAHIRSIISTEADTRRRVLTLLAARGCSTTLLNELARTLDRQHQKTVTSAAAHAHVDRRTLERHWRRICHSRTLRDCIRLIFLMRMADAHGTLSERARQARISIRAAREAAQALTGQPLSRAIGDTDALIAILESWFEPDVAIPS